MISLKVVPGVPGVMVDDRWVSLAEEFADELNSLGYSWSPAMKQVGLFVDFGRWLDQGGIELGEVAALDVDEFLLARRKAGKGFHTRCAVRVLLEWLARKGKICHEAALPEPVVDCAAVVLFEQYLRTERQVVDATLKRWLCVIRRFVAGYVPEVGVSGLTAQIVVQAILDLAGRYSANTIHQYCQVIRSFLWFCYLEGLISQDLSGAVLHGWNHRSSRLPVGLPAQDSQALLSVCDRQTRGGLRDYAVLMVLIRLGLRAGEVAGLMLDDIDWTRAQLTVNGKGNKTERLPIPQNVGDAIAAYLLDARGSSMYRNVFLRRQAPIKPLSAGGINGIVRSACARAGVTLVGPHRLRHSLGEAMVSAGVALPVIGQVLRHDSLSTTANYARVNLVALRQLAAPWPEQVGVR